MRKHHKVVNIERVLSVDPYTCTEDILLKTFLDIRDLFLCANDAETRDTLLELMYRFEIQTFFHYHNSKHFDQSSLKYYASSILHIDYDPSEFINDRKRFGDLMDTKDKTNYKKTYNKLYPIEKTDKS